MRVGVVGDVTPDVDSPAVEVRVRDAESEVSAVDVPPDAVSRVDKKSTVDEGADDVRIDDDVRVGEVDEERDDVDREEVRVGVNASVVKMSVVSSTEVVRKDTVVSSSRVDSMEDDEVASKVMVEASTEVESRAVVDEGDKSGEVKVDVMSLRVEDMRGDDEFEAVAARDEEVAVVDSPTSRSEVRDDASVAMPRKWKMVGNTNKVEY